MDEEAKTYAFLAGALVLGALGAIVGMLKAIDNHLATAIQLLEKVS